MSPGTSLRLTLKPLKEDREKRLLEAAPPGPSAVGIARGDPVQKAGEATRVEDRDLCP